MKRIIATLLTALMLTGCQLASEQKNQEPMQDQLVGVFITFDHLDLDYDIEGWLRDNPGALQGEEITLEQGEGMEYAGRLPVTRSDEGWIVAGHEGLSIGRLIKEDYETTFVSEGVCEVNSSIMTGDGGDAVEVEGTVYFPAGSAVFLCANPVYMTGDGAYYVVQGNSFQSSLESGSMSQSIADERTLIVDGEETVSSAKFTATVKGVNPAREVVLIWMSGDSEELKRETYKPDRMPEAIEAEGAYLIVEEIAADTVSRKLYQPGDDRISVFYQADQIYCLPSFTSINWNN